MKFHFWRGCFFLLGLGLCSVAIANSYSVTVLDDITQLNNPSNITKSEIRNFDLGQRVYVLSTISTNKKSPLPSQMGIKWYRCGKLVRERSLPLHLENVSNKLNYRHNVWFWIKSDSFGPGQFHAEVFADKIRVGVVAFAINPYNDKQATCPASLMKQSPALDTVYFKPGRFNSQATYLASNRGSADEVIHSIFKRYSVVRGIEIAAYSDMSEYRQFSKSLSVRRAETIRSILIARGFHASKLTTRIKSDSNMKKNCMNGAFYKEESQCVQSSQPRVELRVDGDLK